MTDQLSQFQSVWLMDFEFHQPSGEMPAPLCLVAREFRTGRTLRLWRHELLTMDDPPFQVDQHSLIVAYYASAELSCFLSLGWPMPARILDLFVEFRCHSNGLSIPCGNSLLGALAYYGIDGIDANDKAEMRELAQRGGSYSEAERSALITYCESDVLALVKLLPAMLPQIDLSRALLRGRYMAAAARIESVGVPIDTEALSRIRENFPRIKTVLIRRVDADYGVYVPTGRQVDPSTRLGSAVMQRAIEANVDRSLLLEAVDQTWEQEQESVGDFLDSVRAARQATGLTVSRIGRWEDSGKDHSTWPGLDVRARELAAEYPSLGIGRGYDQDEGFDDTDYGARLWDLLRQPIDAPKHKYDSDILDRATTMLDGVSDNERYSLGSLSFSTERFAEYLVRAGIPWPRLVTGKLALDESTFRQMARAYPQIAPLRELRHALGEMRLFELAVGSDGRNRCLLSAFRSITGRNQPSNTKFIFRPSCWLRGLIRPEPGWAIAYCDWSQQEFGIAAALSSDQAMLEAYRSGDPYLAFAKQAGLAPADATKQTHTAERERCKICVLAVQYGMGPQSLAQSLGQPEAYARELLKLHRLTYPVFWRWSQAAVDHAMIRGWLQTVFGWRVHVGPRANPRSLANFPMQANGAEMLRLACCLATERGIRVCAPVHDALLVEGPEHEIQAVVEATQAAMAEASRVVLDGFELRSDANVVTWPDRYMDPRGVTMWETVTELISDLTRKVGELEAVSF